MGAIAHMQRVAALDRNFTGDLIGKQQHKTLANSLIAAHWGSCIQALFA